MLTSVRLAGDLVVVASSELGAQRISILRRGAVPSDPYALEGSIDFVFPAGGWLHSSLTSAVRETGIDQFELFFNVGSRFNNATTTDTVSLSGLISATVNGDAIYRVAIDDSGPTLTASGPEQIATGLRNAFGMALESVSGDLYLQDNGIDGLIDPDEPLSADELNRIAATVRRLDDPSDTAKELVRLANEGGGRDNITCVVVHITEG